MNGIIFEQDKEPQRPYAAKVLLNRARNPRLCLSQPKVNPGSWLGNLLRKQRMTRAQIIEKVAADLWLTLEKRDGVFVFRFPDVWKPKDVQDMQRTVLDGIAMLETQRSLIVWLRDLFGNISAGMARLWNGLVAPIAMAIIGIALLLGTIYAFSAGATAWGVALCIVALLCCSVKISVSYTDRAEPDLENAFPLGRSHLVDPKLAEDSPAQGKLKEPAMSYIAQETRKTHALMKDIEAELEERSDPTRKTIPWGFTVKEAAEGLSLIGAALAPKEEPLKTDDIYDEPKATYPMEMKI